MSEKEVIIELVEGVEGTCIVLNDFRICGPKPWGGGTITKKWKIKVSNIEKALGITINNGINIEELKETDKGKWVIFTPSHGSPKKGRLKDWNEKFLFIVYKCDNNWDNYEEYTGCATYPEAVEFEEE